MKITMTPQAAKSLFEDFIHDELQFIKEGVCEPCKGDIGFWDSDCRFSCEGFIEEALEYIAANDKADIKEDKEITIPTKRLYELLKFETENKKLKDALLSHRWDLHQGSNRPCPTCRESAKALGLKVPDQCAKKEQDEQALKGE